MQLTRRKMNIRNFCILAFFGIALPRISWAVFSATECGDTKTCFQLPTGCDPSSADCVFFSWNWNGSVFNMELSGGVGGGNTYAGVAFGKIKDMVQADLFYCTGTALQAGVIETKNPPNQLNNLPTGVTQTSAASTNGVAECMFTRPASVSHNISGSNQDFDLTTDTYYILLATGSVSGGNLEYHQTNRLISSSRYNMTEGSAVVVTTTPSVTSPSSNDPDCGVSKGCLQFPDGCSATDSNCVYFTWVYNSASNNFAMTISGGAGDGNTYAAVAFGQVNDMQDADLYYCTGMSLVSSAITGKTTPTDQDITTEPITIINTATNDGVATCSFTRAVSITKPISSGNKDFDLTNGTYYILLAKGAIDSGAVQYHGNEGRSISSQQCDLTQNSGCSPGGGADVLEKTHGGLMITAWMILANLGIAIARHFKPLFPKTEPGGVKLWFTLHRVMMVSVFLLTAISFIIIFVSVNGYSSNQNAHAIIGIIVMALAILNPVIALFRPHPHTANRRIFNFTHYFVGISARALATANLFLGVNAIGNMPSWSIGVLGGYCGWMALMEIILEIVTYKFGHYVSTGRKKEDAPANSGTLEIEEPNVGVRGQGVKVLVLAIYALGLLAFAITYYVEISRL